jgi:hypothetical protein
MKYFVALMALALLALPVMAVNPCDVTLVIESYVMVNWAGDFDFGDVAEGDLTADASNDYDYASNVDATITDDVLTGDLSAEIDWSLVLPKTAVLAGESGTETATLTATWGLDDPPATYGGTITLTITP